MIEVEPGHFEEMVTELGWLSPRPADDFAAAARS